MEEKGSRRIRNKENEGMRSEGDSGKMRKVY